MSKITKKTSFFSRNFHQEVKLHTVVLKLAPELIQDQNQEKKSRNLEFQANPSRNKQII